MQERLFQFKSSDKPYAYISILSVSFHDRKFQNIFLDIDLDLSIFHLHFFQHMMIDDLAWNQIDQMDFCTAILLLRRNGKRFCCDRIF